MQEEADAFSGLFDAVKKVFEADVDSCRPVRDMSFAQELVMMPPFCKDAAVNCSITYTPHNHVYASEHMHAHHYR